MDVLIVEDEVHAAKRMEALIHELLPEARIVGKHDSVKKTVEYLNANPAPGLILLDIHLADGLSFDIFEKCSVTSPVIFTTAFDEYALRAFKVNSVDYILKPIDKNELSNALDKLKKRIMPTQTNMLDNIHEAIRMLTRKYKTRFVIKVGEHLKAIETASILYFFSQEKTTFCCTVDNRKLILDFTLEQLEEMVDPEIFFRVNRKYLVSASAINDIINYSNSRLKLVLKNSSDSDVIVARERVQTFRTWLDK